MAAMTDCLSRVKGNLHARFLGEGGQRCTTLTRQITLAWYSDDSNNQVFFDGRIQKITSCLASMCSVFFNREMPKYLPEEYVKKMPLFDCRVWTVPTLMEATNCFIWRELDCTKNSISMAARAYYSHNQIFGKNGSEMQDMLFAKGVNWNNYPDFFRRGTYVQRKKIVQKFTPEELANLPPKHIAHTNPDITIERHKVQVVPMPRLASVSNRVNVIFRGEDPITYSSEGIGE